MKQSWSIVKEERLALGDYLVLKSLKVTLFLYLVFLLGHTVKEEWENPSPFWVCLRVRCREGNQGDFCIFDSICPRYYNNLKEQTLDSAEEDSKHME